MSKKRLTKYLKNDELDPEAVDRRPNPATGKYNHIIQWLPVIVLVYTVKPFSVYTITQHVYRMGPILSALHVHVCRVQVIGKFE